MSRRYLGRAKLGSTSFYRGSSDDLLLESSIDVVDRFIGLRKDSPMYTFDSSRSILISSDELGRILILVPIDDDDDHLISFVDLLFAVERGYFELDKIEFDSSAKTILQI